MYTFNNTNNNTKDERMERAKQILAMFYCSDRSRSIECPDTKSTNSCRAERGFRQKAA